MSLATPDRDYRAGISRADLIRCHEALEPGRFERVARQLGYRPRPRVIKEVLAEGAVAFDGEAMDAAGQPSVAVDVPMQLYHRVTALRRLAPPPPVERTPPWTDGDEPLPEPLPPAPPLVPWPRLWPFLRAVLGESAEQRRVDLDRVVEVLSRGRTLRRLPRLSGRRWATNAQIILDLSPRLYPFWSDFHALVAALTRLRGGAGLEVLRMDYGPDGPVQPWRGSDWGAAAVLPARPGNADSDRRGLGRPGAPGVATGVAAPGSPPGRAEDARGGPGPDPEPLVAGGDGRAVLSGHPRS